MGVRRRAPRVFYGWYIVAIGTAAGFMAAGTSQVFFGVMLKAITEDLGWSRTALSGAVTLGTITGGGLSPLTGWLTDRYGPRLLMTLGVAAMAGTFVAIASVGSVWQFYIAYVVARGTAAAVVGGVVPRTAVVNWFRRMRGRALGILATAVPLGGAVMTAGAQALMGDGMDWRTVFLGLALLAGVLLVVPSALLMRGRPEELGMSPDGETVRDADGRHPTGAAAPVGQPAAQAPAERSWTTREAMRTPALWLITFALMASAWPNGAASVHLVVYLTDRGLGTTAAVAALSTFALSGAVSSVVWGYLTERVSERLLAVGAMFIAAGACAYVVTVQSALGAVLFGAVFGVAARGEGALLVIMLANYYGRRSFGTISGFTTPFHMLGLGGGPLIASLVNDVTGTYTAFWVASVGTFAAAGVLLWLARRPREPAPAA